MEEQIEKYEKGLETIYSNMPGNKTIGAIPKENWKTFLESHLKDNGDLYVPEQVLKIIEQLAVNNNINAALEVYDSMQISLDDFDEVTKIVEEHFPTLGTVSRTYNWQNI